MAETREDRLAAALRANLKRRKAQARDAAPATPGSAAEEAPPPPPTVPPPVSR